MRISDFLCTFTPIKEQVTDISKVLQDMTEEMRLLREAVNQQYAEIVKFNFLENPMIPSDNNGSERGIRKLKIKLKNSCTFRSDFGADAFLELHSIVETAKKHDKTLYNAIQALFKV